MKAGLPKLLDGFVRHAAVSFTPRRPVSKIGDQGMSARDEMFESRGFDGKAFAMLMVFLRAPSKG